MLIMPNFDAVRFAKFLHEAYLNSRFKSHSELAKTVGLSRSTVSSLIGAKPQSQSSKPMQPRPDNVKRLAEALDVDVDEALLRAGHAPENQLPMLSIGPSGAMVKLGTNVGPEEQKEIADELALAYEVIMARRQRRQAENK